MDEAFVDQRLRERDELGIVTERRKINRKFASAVAKRVAVEMSSPVIKAAINRAVNAGLRAEVERIVAARIEQQAKEIAAASVQPDGPPLKVILNAIAEVTEVSVGDLCGPCRSRKQAWPRHLGYHLVKVTRPDLSLPAIGRAFGNRDHTTIMHGLRKVAMLANEAPFSDWLSDPRILALMNPKPAEDA